ncbi:MAG: hypothetical protein N2376_07645 [Clostridia bacterium]|nr:hypothetical protein [Clostridia bacterium]
MKKINSIGFGPRIVKWGLVFSILIPLLLCLAMLFFSETASFRLLIWGSFGVGFLIFLALSVILAIELHQDKRLGRYYSKRRNMKLPIGQSFYECQSCGNRLVKAEDSYCKVCNVRFLKDHS